jgi:hypothetical protein
MAGATGRQGVLTPPRHLIPPLVFPGVRVSLVFTVGYSIYLTGHWFWLRIFPFTWLGVLILTAACSVYLTLDTLILISEFCDWNGPHGGATGQQGMLTPPRHLIPPPVFPGVRVSPFVYLTCNSYLNFETDYSSVSWPFHGCCSHFYQNMLDIFIRLTHQNFKIHDIPVFDKLINRHAIPD